MAVRFDADGDKFVRTTDILSHLAPYTVMAWIRVIAPTPTRQCFWSIANGTTTLSVDEIGLGDDSITLRLRCGVVGGNSTDVLGSAPNLLQWYHVAVVRESLTLAKTYLDGVLNITNGHNVTGRVAANRFECGGTQTANFHDFNGNLHSMKAWARALPEKEIVREMLTIRPHDLTSLYGFWPVFPGTGERTRDYSGNARDWIESGVLTDEKPAPVSWGGSNLYIPEEASFNPALIAQRAITVMRRHQ